MGKNQQKNTHKSKKNGTTERKVARKSSVSDIAGSYTGNAADRP